MSWERKSKARGKKIKSDSIIYTLRSVSAIDMDRCLYIYEIDGIYKGKISQSFLRPGNNSNNLPADIVRVSPLY